MSLSGSIEGLGTKRIFGIHIGMNQNPSKSSRADKSKLSITFVRFISETWVGAGFADNSKASYKIEEQVRIILWIILSMLW